MQAIVLLVGKTKDTKMTATKNIGGRIAAARQHLGYNQSELSRMVGVTAQCVQQWEKGTATPRGKNLAKLSKSLNISEQYVLFGSNDSETNLYMAEAFEKDYLGSIEHLIESGIGMGWFDEAVKEKAKSLANFGLLSLRAKNKAN